MGLSGVKFGLKSYEWLAKSNDREAGVKFVIYKVWLQVELDDRRSC